MVDLDLGIVNLNGKNDDIAMMHLAGALLLHWSKLPDEVRESIYNLAISGNIVGVPQTTSLQQQVDSLLRRNSTED